MSTEKEVNRLIRQMLIGVSNFRRLTSHTDVAVRSMCEPLMEWRILDVHKVRRHSFSN